MELSFLHPNVLFSSRALPWLSLLSVAFVVVWRMLRHDVPPPAPCADDSLEAKLLEETPNTSAESRRKARELRAELPAERPHPALAPRDRATSSFLVQTDFGPMQVTINGDMSWRPKIVTLHDAAASSRSCFGSFFQVAQESALLDHFCVIHLDAPGHWEGAPRLTGAFPSLDDLADMVDQVLRRLCVGRFVGLGVGAGTAVWLRYAAIERQPRRAAGGASCQGLVLFGAECDAGDSAERVGIWGIGRALASSAWASSAKEALAGRLFSRNYVQTRRPVVQSYLASLDQLCPTAVVGYLKSYARRAALSESQLNALKGLPVLLLYGSCGGGTFPSGLLVQQAGEAQALKLMAALGRDAASCATIHGSGVLSTQEEPMQVMRPLELFLEGLGFVF
mmetsp:Transcript_13516/g.34332  ORF Transcript_13516/g.34332 Transcript_13516/m.34332 type:complete len:394 (+) Transcript_13516:89-1270(+)